MAGLLALAIVLLAAVQVHSQTDRADVNDVRLDDLYDRLQTVTKILDDRESSRKGKVKELIELDGRVRDLKGNVCGKRRFQCGTRYELCIHDMLVCDNEPDCPDGSDEENCDNPAPAGTTMTGQTYNVKCSVDQLPTELRVDVIGEKRYNDFPALIDTNIQVTFTYTGGEEKSATYKGVYSFGRRMLVAYPEDGKSLGMTCTFRSSKSTFCHAQFISIVSNSVCGEAVLNIV